MTLANWLILIGGVLLLAGVIIALVANHYETKVMGKARRGVAVLAPQEDSSEWKEKERLVTLADRWFWVGIGLTAVGIVLQTTGSTLPEGGLVLPRDLRSLMVAGLTLDIIGVVLIALPLLPIQSRAFRTEAEVRHRLKESVSARIGVMVLVLGFGLQIMGSWPR